MTILENMKFLQKGIDSAEADDASSLKELQA